MSSTVDTRWDALLSTPRARRVAEWAGLLGVTLLAAVLRLWNLGQPHSLVFDETYYVKDAYTLLNLGYEGSWPDDPNPAFEAGDVDSYLDAGSFIVHPPLGKWLIALGLAVFGAESSVGWRVSVALTGILAVALLWVVARLLLRSALLATVAGGLFAIDGQAIVLSRVALLDNFLMFFGVLAALFVLLDRRQSRERLRWWVARRTAAGRPIDWGPMLWARPWLLAAGVAFGAASAVKWSGLYLLAIFAVYTLAVDAVARRRAGVEFWASGTVLRQAPASFVLMVPVALAVHIASWAGWFATAGGYYRRWAEAPGNAWEGVLAWVPLDWQSWWHYQVSAYNFHVGLSADHGWQSPAWQWLPMLRPTALYRLSMTNGEGGCDAAACESFITTLPNPIIWWLAVASLAYLVVRLIRHRDWRAGFVLTGVAAGFVPWLLYPNRTTFEFYSIVFEPFLILGLVLTLGVILGRPTDAAWRRRQGVGVVVVVLVMCVLVSAFFYPLATGMQTPELFTRSHYWLPGWR